jgi:cyclin B
MMPNIDEGDKENPQLVTEYVNDIYEYLRVLEQKQCIKENFLEGKDVTGRMRSILVDWLSQVHIRFHLLPETLYMTVALIDRFLQEVSVPKEKLQLVGVTSMFVASKYEEMYAPEIGDFVYITDHSCSKHDIRIMECLLLRSLGFNLGRPLPIHFLRRYSKAADADATKHTLAKYFLELALVQYQLSHYPPSIMAAAALWLALKLLDSAFEWSQTLIYYTKYQEADFVACLRRLCRVVVKTHTQEIKQQAIRNKFSTSKFMEISKHPCLDLARIRQFGGF